MTVYLSVWHSHCTRARFCDSHASTTDTCKQSRPKQEEGKDQASDICKWLPCTWKLELSLANSYGAWLTSMMSQSQSFPRFEDHSHTEGVRIQPGRTHFSSLFLCDAVMSLQFTHACYFACRCMIAKLASGLFSCWSLLRNNNMATNLQKFTSRYGSRCFAARQWLITAVKPRSFMQCEKKYEWICSTVSTSLKKLLLVWEWTLVRFLYDKRSPWKNQQRQAMLYWKSDWSLCMRSQTYPALVCTVSDADKSC